MQIRNYSARTVVSYIHCIEQLSVYYGSSPDQLSFEQIKAYLHYYYPVTQSLLNGLEHYNAIMGSKINDKLGKNREGVLKDEVSKQIE